MRRSEEIGLDFEGAVQQLRDVEWAPRLAAATAAGVAMPSYYTRSFHAYPQVRPAIGCSPTGSVLNLPLSHGAVPRHRHQQLLHPGPQLSPASNLLYRDDMHHLALPADACPAAAQQSAVLC